MNIGVFDSGVGGLWILKHLKEKLPEYNYVFFGDQGHVPYGPRPLEEIRDFSETITQFLIEKECNIIVIACNTASAAALKYLRDKFPDISFVGMEPAIKPAAESTHTNKVGVLATPATFQGELYNSVVERFAHDVEIYKDTCDGLVLEIEKGNFEGTNTRQILETALTPMLECGIDTVVLGCTHYPFVVPLIKEIVGENVNIIDPTSAIVKRVNSIILDNSFESKSALDSRIEIFTSGEKERMETVASKLFKNKVNISKVQWKDNFNLIMLK